MPSTPAVTEIPPDKCRVIVRGVLYPFELVPERKRLLESDSDLQPDEEWWYASSNILVDKASF